MWSMGLTAGAYRILGEAGATADTLDVAGAYELPQMIRIALRGSPQVRRVHCAGL